MRHLRGRSLGGKRYECKWYALMEPDYRLREIQRPPGYSHKGTRSGSKSEALDERLSA